MPHSVTITGSFTYNGEPAQGLVRFTPSRLWVMQDGIPWACLAPETGLDDDGSFSVQVTATNTDESWWRYLVDTPAGQFAVMVPYINTGYSLRELIHEHRAGQSTTDG